MEACAQMLMKALHVTGLLVLLLSAVVVGTRTDRYEFVKKPNKTYDFIVVGAGSAGSVIGNRLSEDPAISVLLVEAGGDDTGIRDIFIPALAVTAPANTNITRNILTKPEPTRYTSLKNGQMNLPTGQVLGGSSSINMAGYSRGSRHDFDRWADYTKDVTWSYRHVLPYFKKSEKMISPELRNSKYHGSTGPLSVSRSCGVYTITEKLIQALMDLGYTFNEDNNGKLLEGVSRSQSHVENGERVNSARAFIHPVLHRTNLQVMVNTRVQKIIVDENKRAKGVELVSDKQVYVVEAAKEVIVSAGTIGSPHLLMLSGIGPGRHLEDMNITVHSDLPVGENFQDHTYIDIVVSLEQPVSPPVDILKSSWANESYENLRKGPLAATDSGVTFFTSTTQELKKLDWPDVRILFSLSTTGSGAMEGANYNLTTMTELIQRDKISNGYSCYPLLMRPTSKGTVELKSKDPLEAPVVTPNFYGTQEDVELLFRGIKICKDMLTTKTMSGLEAKMVDTKRLSVCAQHVFDSHDYWSCLIRSRPRPVFHYSGTCKMGPLEDPTAVVDPQLRVKGIKGLRVADASVMPFIVSGSTHAAATMIGEKAADMIKQVPAPDVDNDIENGESNSQSRLKAGLGMYQLLFLVRCLFFF